MAKASGSIARMTTNTVEDFERTSAIRLPVVMDDVRLSAVEGVPTLVEGPQLHPDAAASWAPVGAVWLVTTAERTRAARRQRLVEGDDASRRRVEALVARDEMLGLRLRAAALEARRPVVDVPTDVDWGRVVDAVREVVVTAAAGHPRLAAGPQLAERRRHENDVVHRQITAHERHIGATLPAFPYACTCGRSGCTATVPATSAHYPTTRPVGWST